MQAITNPTALELSREVSKAVAPNDFVDEALNRKNELEQLRDYIIRHEQKIQEKAQRKARQEAQEKTQEEMIIMAIQSNATSEVIEAMSKGAGIPETRLAELKKQAQPA